MPKSAVELGPGWKNFRRILRELAHEIRKEGREDWWVGTAIKYAPFIEFGTRRSPARPFLQPAIFRAARRFRPEGVRARSAGRVRSGRAVWNAWTGDAGLVASIAVTIQGEAKKILTEKGAVDTGLLRASVAAAPKTVANLLKASARATPPSGVSRRTGRRVIRAEVLLR